MGFILSQCDNLEKLPCLCLIWPLAAILCTGVCTSGQRSLLGSGSTWFLHLQIMQLVFQLLWPAWLPATQGGHPPSSSSVLTRWPAWLPTTPAQGGHPPSSSSVLTRGSAGCVGHNTLAARWKNSSWQLDSFHYERPSLNQTRKIIGTNRFSFFWINKLLN